MAKDNKVVAGAGANNARTIERIEAYEDGFYFYDADNNIVGAIGSGQGTALELVGSTDGTNFNAPVRLRGNAIVLQSSQVALKFDNAEVGDFLNLIAKTDVDGEQVFTIGHIPLNVEVYREDPPITDNTDYVLTGTYQEVCAGLTTKAFNELTSQSVATFRIENSSNTDTEIEGYITKNGEAEVNTFTRLIPKQINGSTPSVTDISLQDTVGSDIAIGDNIQLFVRNNDGGALTVKGTTYITTIELIQYTDTQGVLEALANSVESLSSNNLVNVKSTDDLPQSIGGIITFSDDDITYKFYDLINIGTDRINITGTNIRFEGINPSTCGIISATTGDVISTTSNFSIRNMLVLGSGLASSGLKASDAGTDTLTSVGCSYVGFTDCCVCVDNYKAFVLDLGQLQGAPVGVKFSTIANNTVISRIIFEGITDACIDLGTVATNALDLNGNSAILEANSYFLKGLADGGNISTGGFGTVRANKLQGDVTGEFSDNISTFDEEWLLTGNTLEPDSDRVSPNGWGYYVDDAVSTIIAGSGLGNEVQLEINGLNANSDSSYLPKSIRGISELWDTTNNEITPITLGDSYVARIYFAITATSSNPQRINIVLDIGGSSSITIPIVSTSATLKTGTPQEHMFAIPFFTKETFLANKGKIFIYCDSGTATIRARTVLIERISSGAS